jgi:hypothetical protein
MAKRGPKPREEIIWSSKVAYAVGLMATDGCLSGDIRHMELTSKDIQQIENIKDCFAIRAKISSKGPGSFGKGWYYRIQWGDVTLYNFLLEIGLTPHKSLTLGALKIPDEYFFDFLRGSYDGDGSFYSYYDSRWKKSFMFYLTFLSASEAHIFWIRETVERLTGIRGHIVRNGRKCIMTNVRYAKKDSVRVLEKLYPSREVMCLERKRLKIIDALSIVGITLEGLQA